jgi:HK97 family phage major capsid protein
MILQSSLDVENFVRDDLAKVLATAIDKAALKGSGTGGEPLGITNTNGIGTVTITTHTFTEGKLIDLESEVAIDNADLGTLAYLACAADRGRMKKTDIGTDTGRRIWTNVAGAPGKGEVNGYAAYATNQLAEDEVIFGNWEDLIIGEWGVLDLLVNPYAKDTSGGVRITALQDVDTAVRHAESFAKTTV